MLSTEIVSSTLIAAANAAVAPAIHHSFVVAASVCTAVTAAFAGRGWSRFTRPDMPARTILVRRVAQGVAMAGEYGLFAVLLYPFCLTGLVVTGFAVAAADPASHLSPSGNVAEGLRQLWSIGHGVVFDEIVGAAAGGLLSLASDVAIPLFENASPYWDAAQILTKLRKARSYNPKKYFDLDKGCFLGRNLQKKPIYLRWGRFCKGHIQVCGGSGSGKGILLTVVAAQCHKRGDAVIWFDPKFDSFSLRALREIAAETGRYVDYVNLRYDNPAQLPLLAGCKEQEIVDLLVGGFDLRSKGSEGDFHRGGDQDAAMLAAKIACGDSIKSIPDLINVCAKIPEITKHENFWRELRKLASIPALHTREGFDLENAIRSRAIIYIVGECDNEQIKILQKMLLIRTLQVIKGRNRAVKNPHVCLILDEFKHLLGQAALTALGTVRDFGATCILAHQSMGDLADCPGLNPVSVRGAVVDNTSVKIHFRCEDVPFARELSEKTGLSPDFNRSVAKPSEHSSVMGSWGEQDENIVPAEVISKLPFPEDTKHQVTSSLLLGCGEAELITLAPIIIDPDAPYPLLVEAVPMTHVNDLINGGEVI